MSLCLTCRRDVCGRVVDARVLLIGPIRVSRAYLPVPDQCMEAVRIHPEWCRRILGVDPRDHTDALDDYPTVRPDRGRTLLDLLRTTLSPEEASITCWALWASKLVVTWPTEPAFWCTVACSGSEHLRDRRIPDSMEQQPVQQTLESLHRISAAAERTTDPSTADGSCMGPPGRTRTCRHMSGIGRVLSADGDEEDPAP